MSFCCIPIGATVAPAIDHTSSTSILPTRREQFLEEVPELLSIIKSFLESNPDVDTLSFKELVDESEKAQNILYEANKLISLLDSEEEVYAIDNPDVRAFIKAKEELSSKHTHLTTMIMRINGDRISRTYKGYDPKRHQDILDQFFLCTAPRKKSLKRDKVYRLKLQDGTEVIHKSVPKESNELKIEARRYRKIGPQPFVPQFLGYAHGTNEDILHVSYTGETIAKYINRIRQKEPDKLVEKVTYIAREVLKALSFIHKKGIIHSDLKEGNITISPKGNICLIDFGHSVKIDKPSVGTTINRGDPDVILFYERRAIKAHPKHDFYSLGNIILSAFHKPKEYFLDNAGEKLLAWYYTNPLVLNTKLRRSAKKVTDIGLKTLALGLLRLEEPRFESASDALAYLAHSASGGAAAGGGGEG